MAACFEPVLLPSINAASSPTNPTMIHVPRSYGQQSGSFAAPAGARRGSLFRRAHDCAACVRSSVCGSRWSAPDSHDHVDAPLHARPRSSVQFRSTRHGSISPHDRPRSTSTSGTVGGAQAALNAEAAAKAAAAAGSAARGLAVAESAAAGVSTTEAAGTGMTSAQARWAKLRGVVKVSPERQLATLGVPGHPAQIPKAFRSFERVVGRIFKNDGPRSLKRPAEVLPGLPIQHTLFELVVIRHRGSPCCKMLF